MTTPDSPTSSTPTPEPTPSAGPNCAEATGSALPLDHELVLVARTAINLRALRLAHEIAQKYGIGFGDEMELANRISNHVAAEYPEAYRLQAAAHKWLSQPNK